MILFLDDNLNRWNCFRQNTIGRSAKYASNPKRCLDLLYEYEFTDVFLDHDMDYAITRMDGMDVVHYIVLNKHRFLNTKFYIHSLNDQHGPIMHNKLTNIGLSSKYIPWAWEFVYLDRDKNICFNTERRVDVDKA